MSKLFEKLVRPLLFRLEAETAHEFALSALRTGLSSSAAQERARRRFSVKFPGPIRRFGLEFENPLGIAAGFDKNGLAIGQLSSLGFGFVEVGTVTLRPQPGNEKPRLFRLPKDKALINRLGFNNRGAAALAESLQKTRRRCVVGINIGKNKDVPNEEAVENYVEVLKVVHAEADYIAVNISSPNTPNLRDLQQAESLDELLRALQKTNEALGRKPLLVKIAPDLSDALIREAVDICRQNAVAGMIATNTTISRDGLLTINADQLGAGGLSGRPVAKKSNHVISVIYRHSSGEIPIIGVGGIFNARDAFEKIAAGASLLQAYTGFVYGGPSFARDVNSSLIELLDQSGFSSLDDAVGSGVR